MPGTPRLLAAALCAFAIHLPVPVAGQLNTGARTAGQVADSLEIARLARTLTAGAASDSARAAVLYEWIARNLTYDVAGYLSGALVGADAEQVWRTRTAACGGYVALYQRLAAEAGLQVAPVEGYAKGFDYRFGQSTRRPNHAWLALYLGGRWRLLDPTWGSGVVRDGRFERAFTWDFFLTDPETLVLSHFPVAQRWQLVERPMSRDEFERLPAVPRTLVHMGFAPAAIRSAVRHTRVRDFPLVGPQPGLRVLAAPVAGTLRRDQPVEVDLVWPGASDVALVAGGVWTRLSRQGDRFRGSASAPAGTLSVVGRRGESDAFVTALHWQVR